LTTFRNHIDTLQPVNANSFITGYLDNGLVVSVSSDGGTVMVPATAVPDQRSDGGYKVESIFIEQTQGRENHDDTATFP